MMKRTVCGREECFNLLNNRQSSFCSRKCCTESKRVEKVETNCKQCGKRRFVNPSLAGRPFCSRKCMGKYNSIHRIDEESTNYKGKVERICLYQKGTKDEHSCFVQLSLADRPFCNRICMKKYRNGNGNPNWRGGSCSYWKGVIKERDNHECKLCYSTEYLDVNHIYPRNTFPELKNFPGNMITLCRSCHKKYEGVEYIGLFETFRLGGLIGVI